MRALLIGGNGFIGTHLALALHSRGHFVRILDRGSRRRELELPGIEYVAASWTDVSAVERSLDGVDVVYHLVSTTVPATAAANPVADIESNLVGSIRLFEQMVALGHRRIVFLSSGGTVYGNPDQLPVPESAPCLPISSYGIVKLAIERYLEQYRLGGALDPLVVRAANPYGPLQSGGRGQGVIATFTHLALEEKPLPLWGDGTQVRDYLYVGDLARLIAMGTEAGAVGVFNAGSGRGYSVLQIIDAIETAVGKPLSLTSQGPASFGVDSLVLDISRAKDELGWQPGTDLATGLVETIEWMKTGVLGNFDSAS